MLHSLTVWSERPEFGVYRRLDDLPKRVATVLIEGVLDRLGYTPENVSEIELTRILTMCSDFSDRVYGVAAVPRSVALNEVPDDEVGQAFLAVERLVQPNGFP